MHARGVRGALRCGVSVPAVRAVRCFVTLAVSAPRAVRAVCAVRAVRCFVTPFTYLLREKAACTTMHHKYKELETRNWQLDYLGSPTDVHTHDDLDL